MRKALRQIKIKYPSLSRERFKGYHWESDIPLINAWSFKKNVYSIPIAESMRLFCFYLEMSKNSRTPQPGSGLTSARKYGAAYPYPQAKCAFIAKASLTKKSFDGLPYSKIFSEFKKSYKFH